MKIDKLTIVGGIIFLSGIIGDFLASDEIKANPFKYGLSMINGKSDPIILIAQYGMYVGFIGLGLSVFGIYITSTKSMKTCSQCAERVKSEAKICRFCSFDFTEGSPSLKSKDTEKLLTEK